MCDRIGVIKNGELIAIEEVRTVENEEALKEVYIEVEPMETAKTYLDTHLPNAVGVGSKELSMSVKREEIPQILKNLMELGISIYGVRVLQATLEDKFFDLIGENTIE